MDKNTFETYEYLSTNNGGTNANEFFVVQDDGTFLLNRQVQYVAQVEDVKEALDNTQPCAVYDVTPQQFFVDVTDNSSELISVADNYILPVPTEDDTNNLYSNSFLLQVMSNDNSEQPANNLTNEFKEKTLQEKGDVINIVNKKGNTCTEITLTDEQYKSLEQKGWVLLESENKIFILDAYGLHDVTANHDLIQNIRNSSSLDIDTRPSKPEDVTSVLKFENICNISSPTHLDTIDIVEENSEEKETKFKLVSTKEEPISKLEEDIVQKLVNNSANVNKEFNVETSKSEKKKTLKIKTKYCFKDIPDKIFLGKTPNGKKLFAKVVKRIPGKAKTNHSQEFKLNDSALEIIKTPVNIGKDPHKQDDISKFEQLMQEALESEIECSESDVAAANEIVAQLSQVPAFQSCVTGRNVVITKVIETEPDNLCSTNFVTGIVTAIEDGTCRFKHVPDILDKVIAEYIDFKSLQVRASKSVLKPKVVKEPDLRILHVNISETKYENNVETISVVLNERILPCEELLTKRQPSKLHACSSCASIFKSKKKFMEHQESHAMDAEDTLTIDTDIFPESSLSNNTKVKPYHLVKADKGTEYACHQCPMKFNKISNCIRHIKTHVAPPSNTTEDGQDKTEIPAKGRLYKCKMCNCSYFHPASLSKHISKVHIKDKVIFISDKTTNIHNINSTLATNTNSECKHRNFLN